MEKVKPFKLPKSPTRQMGLRLYFAGEVNARSSKRLTPTRLVRTEKERHFDGRSWRHRYIEREEVALDRIEVFRGDELVMRGSAEAEADLLSLSDILIRETSQLPNASTTISLIVFDERRGGCAVNLFLESAHPRDVQLVIKNSGDDAQQVEAILDGVALPVDARLN